MWVQNKVQVTATASMIILTARTVEKTITTKLIQHSSSGYLDHTLGIV